MTTFHQVSSQNLECPICLSAFDQPKSLACSHTFCKRCLERLLKDQPINERLVCPVCRGETNVPGGDASKLQTNIPLSSLVDEVKSQKNPICTSCDPEEKAPAVSYCKECGNNLCDSCLKAHSSYKPNSRHTVVEMSDILSGKVTLRIRRKCKRHPTEDEDYFCPECRQCVCFMCGVLEHAHDRQKMMEAVTYEETLKANIKQLKARTETKRQIVREHVGLIEIQRDRIKSKKKQLTDDVTKTCGACVQQLTHRREILTEEIDQQCEEFEKQLREKEEVSARELNQMDAMEELVSNGMEVPLEKDAIRAHETLRENLEGILGRVDPKSDEVRAVGDRAEKITFYQNRGSNELGLGQFKVSEKNWFTPTMEQWSTTGKRTIRYYTGFIVISVVIAILLGLLMPPVAHRSYVPVHETGISLSDKNVLRMDFAPDGKMAVVFRGHGIHLYSKDGEFQQTVLERVYARDALAFLSDGRCVAHDLYSNRISLYTTEWEKIDVEFETLESPEGMLLDVSVDAEDNIYMSYRLHEKIHQNVFTLHGGKVVVREISYDGHEPENTLSSLKWLKSNLIVIRGRRMVLLDGRQGRKKTVTSLSDEIAHPYPAVSQDGSVIVAWVKHEEGLVTIERYTVDLDHIETLLTNFKIQKPARNWYYLKEFQSGELAFCTPSTVYIFHETWE